MFAQEEWSTDKLVKATYTVIHADLIEDVNI